MKIFYVSESTVIRFDAKLTSLSSRNQTSAAFECEFRKFADGVSSTDSLYFASPLELSFITKQLRREGKLGILKVLTPKATFDLLSGLRRPRLLGYIRSFHSRFTPLRTQLDALGARSPLRLALVTPFTLLFGDAILLLTMIRELRRQMAAASRIIEIHLMHRWWNLHIRRLATHSQVIDSICEIPMSLSQLRNYDGLLDLTFEYVRTDIPWVDALFEAAAIEHAAVPAKNKRNIIAIPRHIAVHLQPHIARLRSSGRLLVLFNPEASSSIRSFPPHRIHQFLDDLLARTDWLVMSAVPLAFTHPRFANVSTLSRTFEHFVYLISQADLFITVDTSLFHVADAFDVPGAVIFTTIDPQLRLQYYPYITGVWLYPNNRFGDPTVNTSAADRDDMWSRWEQLDVQHVIELALRAKASRDHARSHAGCTDGIDRPSV